MDENKQAEEVKDKLSGDQLKKLKLEIESLELRNSWDKGRARYISSITTLVSMITAFVAIAGFLLSANKYFNDREQERISRTQAQNSAAQAQRNADEVYFRTTFMQVLELVTAGTRNNPTSSPSDATSQKSRATKQPDGLYELTSSEVSAIDLLKLEASLDDLKPVVERLPEEKKKRMTKMLIDSLSVLSFTNSHNINVDLSVIEHWKDYEESLKTNEKTHDLILDKYIVALQDLHNRAPEFFKFMEVYPESGNVI